MTLDMLVEEIQSLSIKQRKQLVMAILDSLTDEQPAKTRDIKEFRGVGAHLRDMDAQEYVNQLRSEWDERP
ncbi:MAG: hypothetical protein H7175_25615 [Burkholderiales bacterium]|nr:hypothetical protein [Anaerolineae bacterium]